jgi:branched-chain amino acid transport system permease protein
MSFVLVQVIAGGLMLGAVYALFSSGLTLVWGMMNIVNFAHGDFVMLGMYVAFVVWTVLGVGPFVGAPVAALVLAPRARQTAARLGRAEWWALVRLSLLGNLIYYVLLGSAVQWAGSAKVGKRRHTVTVRATDKSGYTQTSIRTDTAPSGASGWHTVELESG